MKNKNKIPDPRAMEKMLSDLSRLLQRQDFKSKKDLKAYLDGLVKGGKVPEALPKSAVQFAQDIMYEAWETEDKKERIRLAKEALSISPDCADAYNLLAEEEAKTLEEAKELYRKGMEAGRQALGEKAFKENEGHFWGYTPSRPYMRSRLGYMECLWESGEYDEAISHAREMLKLNTSDNQGIRYILAAYLSGLGRYEELDDFINKGEYKDDCSAEWLYTRALLSFVKEGDSDRANNDLKIALKSNQYVPKYLTGKKPIPQILPDRITVGGEDEGFCYASRYLQAWKRVSGAIDWLRRNRGRSPKGYLVNCGVKLYQGCEVKVYHPTYFTGMNGMDCGVKLYQSNMFIIKICYNGPKELIDFINQEVHYGTIIGAKVND